MLSNYLLSIENFENDKFYILIYFILLFGDHHLPPFPHDWHAFLFFKGKSQYFSLKNIKHGMIKSYVKISM